MKKTLVFVLILFVMLTLSSAGVCEEMNYGWYTFGENAEEGWYSIVVGESIIGPVFFSNGSVLNLPYDRSVSVVIDQEETERQKVLHLGDEIEKLADRARASSKFANLYQHIVEELEDYPCWKIEENGQYIAGKSFKSGWLRLLYIGDGNAHVTLSRSIVSSPGGMSFFADDYLTFGAKESVPFASFHWLQEDNSCYSVYDFPIPKGTILDFESDGEGDVEMLLVQFIESL